MRTTSFEIEKEVSEKKGGLPDPEDKSRSSIADGSKWNVCFGYLDGAILMIIGAVSEWAVGVEASDKSLESISQSLQRQKLTTLVSIVIPEDHGGNRVLQMTL